MSRIEQNRAFSEGKIDELKQAFAASQAFRNRSDVTSYAVGSIGRLEASESSDIDAFFVQVTTEDAINSPKLKKILLFADFIKIVEQLKFPEISNDGQFLEILSLEKMKENFGAPEDDYDNLFTARMLLILESKCLYNEVGYNTLMDEVLNTYFRDFEDHSSSFRPTVLMNDIIRYWKTLCLNYENRRNDMNDGEQTKFQLKNIKLKFSRMLTCFGTVAAIGGLNPPVSLASVKSITTLPPLERLKDSVDQASSLQRDCYGKIEEKYERFLDFCDNDDDEPDVMEAIFEDAEEFSKALYEMIKHNTDEDTFRRLVL